MSVDDRTFDPFRTLTDHAERLNALCSPARCPKISYEIMSGALVWSDEIDTKGPVELAWALRYVFGYRTSLMLNQPREELKPMWDHALSLCPNWVGFRPERRQATPELLEIYRRGNISLKWCLRKFKH